MTDTLTRDGHTSSFTSHERSPGANHAGSSISTLYTRTALVVLLASTALLYLWNLSASGWANSFYSAAVQAGSVSWKAFFFGSSDAANSITVDKTPLALWPMMLSVRVFGLNSWAILVPQALEGIAAVGLLYATVRRMTGNAWAGLGAGLILAITPVATLMFRFNNPDAMLVLLLIGSVYATWRAIEAPQHAARWIALAGALVGLGFLAKMLQAFLVLPALAGVYLLCAGVPLMKRVAHVALAAGTMVLGAGWWVAIASLWPAADRPYFGGSQDNSVLELALGYNGFGRLTGNETGSVGGVNTSGTGGQWGNTGLFRMFNTEIGGQIAWLLPAAFVLLVAGLIFAWRKGGRTDNQVRGLVVWGGWLIVTFATFSFMAGIFHAYYTVALAPAVAAIVAIGAHVLWQHRRSDIASLTASFTVALSSSIAFILLNRTSEFVPWLKWFIIVVGTMAAVLLALWKYSPRVVSISAAAAAIVALSFGPLAYSVATAASAHSGSIVSAGPTSNARQFGSTASSSELVTTLSADSSSYTWVAAAVRSDSAAQYQLATGLPVMSIGGFNGTDPSPTFAQFKQYALDGKIHYFIASGGTGAMPGGGQDSSNSTSSQITAWVKANFSAQTIGNVTLYDLTETQQ